MANNTHAVFQGTHCAYMDIDAYTLCGIGAADFDNGNFVTVGAVQISNTTTPGGFEVAISAPAANATGLFVCRTPEVGTTLEMQMYNDPRCFYNITGLPVSIAKIVPGDYITVTAPAFNSGTAPTTTNKYCSVNTSGLLVAGSSAPAAGTYFTLEAVTTIDIGQEAVPAYLLKCAVN